MRLFLFLCVVLWAHTWVRPYELCGYNYLGVEVEGGGGCCDLVHCGVIVHGEGEVYAADAEEVAAVFFCGADADEVAEDVGQIEGDGAGAVDGGNAG